MTAQEKLSALVDELLRTHVGGEGYFSTLDARLQLQENLDIVQAALKDTGDTVVTGSFGHYVRMLREHRLIPRQHRLLHFSGGLRTGEQPRLLWSSHNALVASYTFVDDSFYSGKTYRAIQQAMADRGSALHKVRVIYDGSPDRLPNVSSLYRYYDIHAPLARDLLIH